VTRGRRNLERHVDSAVVVASSTKLSLGGTELHCGRGNSFCVGFLVGVKIQAEHAVVGRLSLHEWRVDASSDQGAGAHRWVVAHDRSCS
jgi:hypothetical protein